MCSEIPVLSIGYVMKGQILRGQRISGYPGFLIFLVGFGVWEGRESIGIGLGIHLDGFSAREVEYGPISNDFHDFAIVVG